MSDPYERPNFNWIIEELKKEIGFYKSSKNGSEEENDDDEGSNDLNDSLN